ncbi:hypothetical protein G5I_07283 [Acromyrmex echinatior]|uniref:Uncharacterized protein n=1 Tax=Acromyrmex echinatior TaxID=103372 RepID=F4WNC8_ACREC|nr:hypothetical protein G5I_07283 [Acromyrmex echinatior]
MSADRYTKGNPEEWNAIAWNRARKGTDRTTIAQVHRLNRDFGNPKREGGGRRTAATRDGKRGLASAVSSNRLDNLQEALEPRCGAGLVEDLPSGYPRNPVGLACRILHVPEALARGSS